jgi:3-hydroxy-9,10-secoandrosta-1,3,5(10)-triene-9,17-dione monooxygenase
MTVAERSSAKETANREPVPSVEELVDRARALVPYLKEKAADADKRRSLSAETVRKLFDAGLLRFFQPRRFGGWEMDWGTQYFISKEIAHGCPSTAWIVSVVGQHTCHAARFPKEAQEEVWSDSQDIIVATSSVQRPGSSAVRVKGGFIVNGGYGFSSAIDHSAWGLAVGAVEGEGPARYYFLMPRKDYDIEDVWHVIGMRGTGTKDLVVHEAFVPEYRALLFSDFNGANPPGAVCNDGYIYAMEMGLHVHGSSPLGPVVGTAEAALADYLEITRDRVSAILGSKVAESDAVHFRVSESASEIHAADLIARTDLQRLHERGKAGDHFNEQEMLELQRNRGFIAELCVRSVNRLVRMMGATGIFDENPLNRYFRDIHAMTTQVGVAWDFTMPHWGRWALGVPARGAAALPKAKDAGPPE